jgi:hypothetical protein
MSDLAKMPERRSGQNFPTEAINCPWEGGRSDFAYHSTTWARKDDYWPPHVTPIVHGLWPLGVYSPLLSSSESIGVTSNALLAAAISPARHDA